MGLHLQPGLKGAGGNIVAVHEGCGRFLVELQRVAQGLSVRPRDLIRRMRVDKPKRIDPRAWTVSRVAGYLRACGHISAARKVEQRAGICNRGDSEHCIFARTHASI